MGVHPPLGDLDVASLAPLGGGLVIFQYYNAVPPVLANKLLGRPVQVQDDPGHPGKGQGHRFLVRGKIPS